MSPVKSISLHIVGMIFQSVTMLVTGIFVARMIGAQDYGISTILRSLLQFAGIVAPLGLDLYLQKYIAKGTEDAGQVRMMANRLRLLAVALGILIVAALAAGGGAWLEAHIYRIPHFATLVVLTFVSLPFLSDMAILGGIYRGRFKPAPQIAISFYVLPLLRLGMLVPVLGFGFGLEGVVIVTTASAIVSALLLNLHYQFRQDRNVVIPVKNRPTWSDTFRHIEPSSWLAASLFFYGSIRTIDVLVLGLFLAPKEIGEYGLISTMAQFIQFIPHALSQTLGPTVAMLFAAGDLAGIRSALNSNLRRATIMAAPIFAGVALWSQSLNIFFGHSFQFLPSVSFGLALGYYISSVTGATGFALSMTGRHRAETAVLIAGNALALGGCYVLIPLLGQNGAAIASCLAYGAINFARITVVSRVIGKCPGSWRDLLPPAAAFVLGWTVFHSINGVSAHNALTFVLSGFVFVAAYGALAWIAFLSAEEKEFIGSRAELAAKGLQRAGRRRVVRKACQKANRASPRTAAFEDIPL